MLGFHAEFVRESTFGRGKVAAADRAAVVFRVLVAHFADLEYVDHFLVGACFHACRDVARDRLGIVRRLAEQSRRLLLSRLARAGGKNFGRVQGADLQAADLTFVVLAVKMNEFADHINFVVICRSGFRSCRKFGLWPYAG